MNVNRTPRNIIGPAIKRVEAKLPERADGTRWECPCGRDLFGIFKGGKLHIKYQARTLFVDGVVRARCRYCGNESVVNTVRVGGVKLHTTADPEFLEKMLAEMEADKEPKPEEDGPEVSHWAVKLAEKHGIDIKQVKGTGKNGKVLKSDVEALVEDLH